MTPSTGPSGSWQRDIYRVLKSFGIAQACYVPDAGHAELIRMFDRDPAVASTLLTTEQEGVALCAGAWLGGQRAVLLMQSSGAGNCMNMLSLIENLKLPFLALVTMRGEWGEFNPWQVPMGRATPGALALMGVATLRADSPAEVEPTVRAAATGAWLGHGAVAVLLSQKLIGAKAFDK